MQISVSEYNTHYRIVWKLAGLAVVVAVLLVARQFLPLDAWLSAFNAWVGGVGALGMLLYAGFYALAVVLLLPGSVLTIGAGFLFGLVWGTLVVSAAATTGAALAFLVARYVARGRVAALSERNARFRAVDRAIGREGWKIVGLLRLSPAIPFSLSNYLYGLTAVRFWPYVLATWAGTLPGTVMYVYLGAAGRAGLQAAADGGGATTPMEQALFALGLLATVAVTVLVTRVARRALQESEVEK